MFRLLALCLLIVSAQAAAPPAKPWQRVDGCHWKADRWNDGDSFHVLTGDEAREIVARLYFVDTPEAERLAMLRPYPADAMTAHPISTRVNKPGNDDDPTLIDEVPPATALPTRPSKPKPDDGQRDLFG